MTSINTAGYFALRNSVALSRERDLNLLVLRGQDPIEIAESIFPCDLFLHDGQMKHTLFLRHDGTAFADVYIAKESDDIFILSYGPEGQYLTDWIHENASEADHCEIIDLRHDYEVYSLDGPYAWELGAELLGPDVLGIPYLGSFRIDDKIVFRAGRTGEYGYVILVPKEHKSSFERELGKRGKPFDLVEVDEPTLSQCVLENFFFDCTREGAYKLNPMELQLQWRLSTEKTNYVGYEAIKGIRESGWDRRLTFFCATSSIKPGDQIEYESEIIGEVVSSGYSPFRKDWVGKALIVKPYWHAGIDLFKVNSNEIKTLSAPGLSNKSLRVSPYNDSYHTDEDKDHHE